MAVGMVLRATVVGVLVLAAAACGDDDDGSTSAGGASQSLCSSLQSLDSTVMQITNADVDPETTTIGDVQNAVDEVQSDLQDVQTSGADLASSLKTALQSCLQQPAGQGRGPPERGDSGGSRLRRGGRRAAARHGVDERVNAANCSSSS